MRAIPVGSFKKCSLYVHGDYENFWLCNYISRTEIEIKEPKQSKPKVCLSWIVLYRAQSKYLATVAQWTITDI